MNGMMLEQQRIYFLMWSLFIFLCSSNAMEGDHFCGADECCIGYFLKGEKCIECPAGKIGLNCQESCPSNKYGTRCLETCECSSEYECDPAIGCIKKGNNTKEALVTGNNTKAAMVSNSSPAHYRPGGIPSFLLLYVPDAVFNILLQICFIIMLF